MKESLQGVQTVAIALREARLRPCCEQVSTDWEHPDGDGRRRAEPAMACHR